MNNFLYMFSRFLFLTGMRIIHSLKVKGLEHVPKKGAFICAANHASFLDPAVMGASLPRPISFMAKKDLFEGRFGWWIKDVGCIPLSRDRKDVSAIKEAMRRLKETAKSFQMALASLMTMPQSS